MARNKLSLENQLLGVTNALKNPNTPKQFREGLKKRLQQLKKAVSKK